MHYLKNVSVFVKNKVVFCGIDVHESFWVFCLICDGELLEKTRIPANYAMLKSTLNFYAAARTIRIVYEAGFCGFWLWRNLKADGYDCIVTPPNRIPKAGSAVKTDKRDAQSLAQYLAADLLKAVSVPPPDIEADRRIGRSRKQTAKDLTRIKNQIKAFLHLHELKRPQDIKSNWSPSYLAWLTSLPFEYEADRMTLARYLEKYHRLRNDLAEVTHDLRKLAQSDKYRENYKRITALRGVGLVTAMTFLLELFDFSRFQNERQFSSYLGLTPSQHSSGEHVRLGHITRQGNTYLRGVLVESAWTVIRYCPHLQAKYNRIRARGTNGKKAIVAVARSLAVRLRSCLLHEQEYVIGVC